MKKLTLCRFALVAVCLAAAACATQSWSGLSLDEAIDRSVADIAAKFKPGTRVAIVAFEAEHANIAGYIMDEITGAFVNSSIEVADRDNLEYVYKELNFQMTGDVSDETAVGVGKFLAAHYVITG